MSEKPQNLPKSSDLQARLHESAKLLRESDHIESESQKILAELLDELSNSLNSSELATPAVAHLADSAAHLAESLHRSQEQSLISKARDRLRRAVVDAETHAPMATGLTRRLLDVLTNAGI